jgi:hypothetical protein
MFWIYDQPIRAVAMDIRPQNNGRVCRGTGSSDGEEQRQVVHSTLTSLLTKSYD